MELGLACHVCGQLNLIRAQSCNRCGTVLAPTPTASIPAGSAPGEDDPTRPVERIGGPPAGATVASPSSAPAGATVVSPDAGSGSAGATVISPDAGSTPAAAAEAPPPVRSNEAPGEQAPQQRFDPATGQRLDDSSEERAPKTMFFGALQQQVVPRLVVIKGEGGDGNTYHLQATQTSIGRDGVDVMFPEDPFLSPQHAKFTSQDGRLFVQDTESVNGVFLRIKKPTPLGDEDYFLVGEQLLRLENQPFSDGAPDTNGTYFYGSPRPEGSFRVVQCLAGGGEGCLATADGNSLSIGREGNTLNFPEDRFISGQHARLDLSSDTGNVILTDTGSRNGTFVRIKGAQELFHGDYLFVGQQLLRVEIS